MFLFFCFVFFFGGWDVFSRHQDKKVDYTRGKSSNDDDVNDDDANAGVYFFTPSRRKNAHASRAKVLARLDATEHARAETSRFRRRLFFSRTREGGGCVDFEFSSRKGGKKLGLVSSRRSLSISNPTERALTETPLSSPLQRMVARTNRSTSRLPELPPRLAPGSPSTPLRYVSLFVYLVGLFWIEFTKSSLKKKRKFYRFLSFFEENFDSSTHQEVPHKKE